MRKPAILISLSVLLAFAPVASAASTFQISGGGFGHGIGMSQYGAYGYALHGEDYQFILAHYYQGTTLSSTNPNQTVRVLLGSGAASFSGATRAGAKKLSASETYSVKVLSTGALALYNQAGKKVKASFGSTLTATGPGPLNLAGHGAYDGALVFTAVGNQVQTVNAVGLDDYVEGVVPAEMPSAWAAQALDAQAVAARTYALTSNVQGNGYQLYDDTRSQMYGGVSVETAATNAAVAATRGQILTYLGLPATTYFFSSSGGYTEDIQNVWLGATPEPWLRGVPDPYDNAGGNPYHHWSYKLTMASAQAKLGSLVKGKLVGIKITKQGVSPRVISAQVVGTKGQTNVTGPQLQSIFALPSTYMAFTTISAATGAKPPAPAPTPTPGVPSTGGVASLRPALVHEVNSLLAVFAAPPPGLHGSVFPARKGAIALVQRLGKHGWTTARVIRLGRRGSYRVRVSRPGTYRLSYHHVVSPTVTVG
jgi:stage II sporulation protein D